MLQSLLMLSLAAARDPDARESEPRVSIGESAADVEEETVPTGLPPDERRRGQTVDDEPESQETG